MAPPKNKPVLLRVEAFDVQRWFREAWPKQNQHPSMRQCCTVAIKINVIVDRQNASAGRSTSAKAFEDRRQIRLQAGREARTLQKTLAAMARNLHDELSLTSIDGLILPNEELKLHISVVEQMQVAIDRFLDLPRPPKYQDHVDPVLWIAITAKAAWHDTLVDTSSEDQKGMFGYKPDSPLVHFTSLVLEAIGPVGDGQQGNSFDTISDHLRQRQNRPRKNRAGNKKVGEN